MFSILKNIFCKNYIKNEIKKNKIGAEKIDRIKKVVIFCYFNKEISDNEKYQKEIEEDFKILFGYFPTNLKAKKSVANFNIRKGMIMGKKIVLGNYSAHKFLRRLFFSLINFNKNYFVKKTSFDKNGNLNIGIDKQIIFPEIKLKDKKILFGLNICIIFSKKDKETNFKFLNFFKIPLIKSLWAN